MKQELIHKSDVKIIFVDIDCTLYDHKYHKYDKKSFKALNKLQKDGVKIIITTARPYYSVKDFHIFDYIKPDGLILSCGAVTIYDNKLIHASNIDKDVLYKIVDVCKKYDLCIEMVETYDRFYATKKNDYVDYHHVIFKEIPAETKEYNGQDINSLLLFAPKELDETLQKELPKSLRYLRFSDYGVDLIMSPRDKGDAVIKLLEYLSLDKENAMSFGDDFSDMKMNQSVHYGIAMGNGRDELKKVSFDIALPVWKHGVYRFLRKNHIVKIIL